MHTLKKITSAFTVMSLTIGSAIAGPTVTVTFKNLGDNAAIFAPQDSNQFVTRSNASPLPQEKVSAGETDTFRVTSRISPLTNYASVRYVMGNKSCEFLTTFVATPGFAGAQIPKWKHSATPGSGAQCTVRSTGVSLADYSWSVEMTMR